VSHVSALENRRLDVKARLLGYVLLLYFHGEGGLGIGRTTMYRLRRELREAGLDKIDGLTR
jgi:hypothetical protein